MGLRFFGAVFLALISIVATHAPLEAAAKKIGGPAVFTTGVKPSSVSSAGPVNLYNGPELTSCGTDSPNVYIISNRRFDAYFNLNASVVSTYRAVLINESGLESLLRDETVPQNFVAGRNLLSFMAPVDTLIDRPYQLQIIFDANGQSICLSAQVRFDALTDPTNVGSAADPTTSLTLSPTSPNGSNGLTGLGSSGGCELSQQASSSNAVIQVLLTLLSVVLLSLVRRRPVAARPVKIQRD